VHTARLMPFLVLAGACVVIARSAQADTGGAHPSSATASSSSVEVAWIRAGVLLGPSFEPEPAFEAGTRLSLFEINWPHFYVVPVAATWTMTSVGRISFAFGVELGWLHRWGANQLRLGISPGFGVWGLGDSRTFTEGAAMRPAIRYRHYWARLGLELAIELPLVVGRESQGGSPPVVVHGWTPLLGLSIGM